MKKLLLATIALTAIGVAMRANVQLVKTKRKNFSSNTRVPLKASEIYIDWEDFMKIYSSSSDKEKPSRWSNIDNQLAQVKNDNVIQMDRGMNI